VTQRHWCGFAVALGVLLFDAGCSSTSKPTDTSASSTTATGNTDSGGAADGSAPANPAQPKPIGTPCTPDQEVDPSYAGASYDELGVMPGATSCNGGVCVVDHFQGRTTCPYGQEADGGPVPGASSACALPGTTTPVEAAVAPWCSNRPPSDTVTCSCRCEDVNGGTDDSGAFCTCPAGFTCTQLVSSLGAGLDTSLTGGYCIKTGTAFGPDASACRACDPATNPCP
jgi:hypothetical protein